MKSCLLVLIAVVGPLLSASHAWAALPNCQAPVDRLAQPLGVALGAGLARLQADGIVGAPVLPAAKLYVLYFGASWCGPCRLFSRKLKPIYQSGDPARLGYEVIFVTRDRTAAKAYGYVAQEAMPWPFLRHEHLAAAEAVLRASAPQAPDLVVVDANGRIYCSAYDTGGRYRGVYQTFQAMRLALGAPQV